MQYGDATAYREHQHEPTDISRARVESLVAFGIQQPMIAAQLGISDETLRKYYRAELEVGLANATELVANRLFAKAVDNDDLAAQIFFLKTRARWRDRDPEDSSKQALSIIENLLKEKDAKK